MSDQSRFMLVVPPLMENSPAFDRAAALAKAADAALHIVAFDYLEGLATGGPGLPTIGDGVRHSRCAFAPALAR